MHIALFTPAWPLETYPNGIVTYVHWMREGLRSRGHKVSVFAGSLDASDKTPLVYPVDSTLVERTLQRAKSFLGSGGDPLFAAGGQIAAAIARHHSDDPIDVLEMEESFGWAASMIDRRLFPVVVKLHGPAFLSLVEEDLESDFAVQKIRAEGVGLEKARVIISPSLCTLEDTLNRYALKPFLSQHVVNPLTLRPGTDLWSESSAGSMTILFVGRFDKRKGGDRVLQSFKKVLERHPEARLVFVGPDRGLTTANGDRVHFASYVDAIFTVTERERILYLGAQSQEVIGKLRCEAAMTVVASRWESQGYTALEAMLQGCPLVCADTSGLSESVTHLSTGLLFQGNDIDDMAAQIVLLLDRPELAKQLGETARDYVLEQHGVEQVVDRTLKVYRSAIADFNGAGGRP